MAITPTTRPILGLRRREGLWGASAYWNGNVYIWPTGSALKAFAFANGAFTSPNPSSQSTETAGTYSPTPSVSANGTTNGIVWSLKTDNYSSQGTEILYAHDASNVATLLYSSAQNSTRDNPGKSVKFIVPTVINGKVYVGSESQLSVFGLLNGATQAATPAISPVSQTFSTSIQVTISDTTPGTTIYYTTDGIYTDDSLAQIHGSVYAYHDYYSQCDCRGNWLAREPHGKCDLHTRDSGGHASI